MADARLSESGVNFIVDGENAYSVVIPAEERNSRSVGLRLVGRTCKSAHSDCSPVNGLPDGGVM